MTPIVDGPLLRELAELHAPEAVMKFAEKKYEKYMRLGCFTVSQDEWFPVFEDEHKCISY